MSRNVLMMRYLTLPLVIANSCHPNILTKIIIYAYTHRIYSSRKISKAFRENIPIMWLKTRQLTTNI
ncbi:transposase [Paenibacillus sp. Leaf72]|uniref:transposase n=1 Tax=Paenibacillus sp. Leaf72 TaxID=1736234 RepID=UPI0009D6C4E9|nr:transposase [Paenibacillus sp. Leaf72]